jgi:hypothetical protein
VPWELSWKKLIWCSAPWLNDVSNCWHIDVKASCTVSRLVDGIIFLLFFKMINFSLFDFWIGKAGFAVNIYFLRRGYKNILINFAFLLALRWDLKSFPNLKGPLRTISAILWNLEPTEIFTDFFWQS